MGKNWCFILYKQTGAQIYTSHHWMSMNSLPFSLSHWTLTVLTHISSANKRALWNTLMSWQALTSSSGIWISFLSTRSFPCYELLSYVSTFLCYELVLWILGENKTIITNFSSPLNSPIHFLCFSYMDEIFSLRLIFICSWQTLSVFPLGEINQKI